MAGKVIQRVIATIGRMDQLQQKNRIETLIQSLSRFLEKALPILSGRSELNASGGKIGPALNCKRHWKELGIEKMISNLFSERKFEFDVEKALFLTVLYKLFISGSDRSYDRWRRDYVIEGVEGLSLHHFYRAMAFVGQEGAE